MTICQTFINLSHETWTFLEKARDVKHQPLEETITDKIVIELKALPRLEVKTTTFSRRRERGTGADWEWWFTNEARSAWFGVRVQAKILNFVSNRYEALNYKSKASDKDQTSVLISDAENNSLYPLYCFYSHWPLATAIDLKQCRTFPNAPESYGCSLVDAYTIKNIKSSADSNSLASIMAVAYPWSCLVCCKGGLVSASGSGLPRQVRSFLDGIMPRSSVMPDSSAVPEVKSTPPDYVIATMQNEGDSGTPPDENLAGVMVIVGNDSYAAD